MTDEELYNLEALYEATTPGDWRVDLSEMDDVVIWGEGQVAYPDGDTGSEYIVGLGVRVKMIGNVAKEDAANAQAICAEHNATPQLIICIRDLRSTLEKVIASRRELEAELFARQKVDYWLHGSAYRELSVNQMMFTAWDMGTEGGETIVAKALDYIDLAKELGL